jgi:hypothetical protein
VSLLDIISSSFYATGRSAVREFAKVSPQFWISERGREIKGLGINAQLISLYLLTSPHSSMIGIYYLPIAFIAHETGIFNDDVITALNRLSEINFCTYDLKSEYIWVHDMAFEQLGVDLKPSDNRVKGFQEALNALPHLPFLNAVLEKYAVPFHMENFKDKSISPSKGPSKPLASKEKEKEKENDKDKEKEKGKEKEKEHCAESKNDSAFIQNKPSSLLISGVIDIPLKDGTQFSITSVMITKWKTTFPNVDVSQVLKNIQDWNIANPKKRKKESGILRHINLWLAREQDKYKNGFKSNKTDQRNTLFNLNQTIADDWLKKDSTFETGERH